ncbi:MAG: heparinase II/III family protein [Pseudomonadota bacterium]
MSAQTSQNMPARERSAGEDAALWARFRGVHGEPVKPAGKSWLKLVPSTPPSFDWTAFAPIDRHDARQASRILRRTWTVGLERFSLEPDDLPWAIEGASHHFLDRVHRFDWLPSLMASGPDGEALGLELVNAWIASHGRFDGFSWRAEPCADRIWHWMRCGAPLLQTEDGAIIHDRQDCLLRQIDHLEGLLDTPQPADARLRGACILVVMAVLQADDTALTAALERLDTECAAQILPDGGHGSRAPEKLLGAAIDLLAVRGALVAKGHETPKAMTKWLSRMGAMLAFFQAGDGALDPFNGGSEGQAADVQAAIDTIDPAIRKFSFSPKSGYQKLERGPLRLLLDVGSAPADPFADCAHSGALGFELGDGRDRLVTSCGYCDAVNVDWQAAVRRTSAHSTLVLGGRDSAAFAKNAATGLLQATGPDGVSAKRLEESDEIWLDAQHSGYREMFGLLHRRRLFMAGNGDRLTGEDSLARPVSEPEAEDAHPVQYDIRFHLHPGVEAVADRDSIRIVSESGNRWRFKTSHPGAKLEPSIYLGRGTVERTQQIVLAGRADPNGDGESPENCVRWAFVRDNRE